jgi:hypothetical protein
VDATKKRLMLWIGRVVSLVPVAVLLMSATLKLTGQQSYAAEWQRIGYSASALKGMGLLQIVLVVLYLIPPTAVLGTVLLTGYLGGAIASYVRLGEPYPVLVPLTTALLAWAGLYLREERLWSLLPWRRRVSGSIVDDHNP